MSRRGINLPVALTVAGSDSGGGAGIQADLKVFAALGVHGTSAISCITAQNPRRVSAVQPIFVRMVRKQIEAVLAELPPRAAKTGMLFSTPIINAVADCFGARPRLPLVVDPVMVATSGAVLLQSSAIRALKLRLLPRATLVTPNLDEAQLLVNRRLSTLEDLLDAASEIYGHFGCAALVKGGHLKLRGEAVDVLYDGRRFTVLKALRIKSVSTHGTGCTFSAAITAYLARGESLTRAVELGKHFITRAVSQSQRVGCHSVLNCFTS